MKRSIARRTNPSNRYRSDREDILAKVQNKFVDAYQLMKESDGKKGITDQYNRVHKIIGKEGTTSILMKHTDSTLYVNVMVKNSVEVVRKELERLAKERWDVDAKITTASTTNTTITTTTKKLPSDNTDHENLHHHHHHDINNTASRSSSSNNLTRFERFRIYTQRNIVKLAGIALASDFTVRPYNIFVFFLADISF
jgi:hypothetical protein